MERQLQIIAYLIARAIGNMEGVTAEDVLNDAIARIAPKKDQPNKEKLDDDIAERVYKLYPTKCPVSGRATGKCSKNKKQIEALLKKRTPEDIELTIREYLADCKNHNTYIKNFGTFLNQFPDKKEERVSEPTVERRSPELMAIDAMHAGVTDASVVRNGILCVWENLPEERIRQALYNAGYIQ